MAESLTIARPYAEAAFKLASEQGTLASWSDALSRLAAVVADPLAKEVIGSPQLTSEQVASLVADTGGNLANEQRNFVRVLAENERLAVLPDIASQFEVLRSAFEGVLDAQISSAFPLSDAQVNEIVQLLAAKHGRQVKASVIVDSALIGGVSIRVGDEVTDASVRGKLAQLSDALKA